MNTKPVVALAALLLASPLFAQTTRLTEGTIEDRAQRLIDRGIAALHQSQQPDGGWLAPRGALAISALAAKTLVQSPAHAADARTTAALDYILRHQSEDGGIYRDGLASYNTSICISALARANNPAYKPRIDKAVAYLKSLQWADSIDGLPKGEKIGADDPRVGGWGYGSKGRPDGSNTSFALDALIDAGVPADDEVVQKAAKFVTRNQNISTNDQPWASNDGGFIYSTANGGESFAGEYKDADGKRRFNSYGSMTYAGMKSLLYAGVSRQDPRVVAAHKWLSETWTLAENPGMQGAGPQHARDGLYYYYHVLARSLHAYANPTLTTPTGKVDWRKELVDALELAQQPNGTWIGGSAYMETNPTLVTAYAVLALQEVLADLKK